MAGPEVKAVGNLLGTRVSYAYAVKAGRGSFLMVTRHSTSKAASPKRWQGRVGELAFSGRASVFKSRAIES